MRRGTDGGNRVRRGWRRIPGHPVFPLVAEGFLSRLSFGIISLALPLYAFQLGMSIAQIGVLLSLNLVVALVLKPLMGALADRVGLKRTLVAAIFLRSVVSLLFVFATSPWHLFAIRGLHGVSIALRDPATYALVAEAGGKKQIASSFAWYQTSKTLAGSVGRAIAGIVLGLAGGFPLTFAVAFVLSALPLLIVAVAVHEPVDPPDEVVPAPADLDGTLPVPTPGTSRAPILPFAMVGFLITGSAYLFTALFPVFATEYAGLSPTAVGFIYVIGSLMALTGPVWGWLADRTSFGLVLSLRSFANVASSVVFLAAPNLGGVAVGKALDDTGKAAFRPAWGAMMAHVAAHDRRRRARIMAWLGVGEDAGEVAGPIIAGLVWTAWGIPALLGIRIAAAVMAEVATGVVTHKYGSVGRQPGRRSRRAGVDPGPNVRDQATAGGAIGHQAATHRQAVGFGPTPLRKAQSVAGGLGLDGRGVGRASSAALPSGPQGPPDDDPEGTAGRRSLERRVARLARRAEELEGLVQANRQAIDDDRAVLSDLGGRHDRLVSTVNQALPGMVSDAVHAAMEAEAAALSESVRRGERVRNETQAVGEAIQASSERMMEALYRRDQEVEARADAHRRRLEDEALAALAELLEGGRQDVVRSVIGQLPAMVNKAVNEAVNEAVRAAMDRYATERRAVETGMASRLRADAELQHAAQQRSFETMMAARQRDLDDRAAAHERAHRDQQQGLAELRNEVTRLVTQALPAMVADAVRTAADLDRAEREAARQKTERLWAETEAIGAELGAALAEMRAALAREGALEQHASAYHRALEELRSAMGRPVAGSNGTDPASPPRPAPDPETNRRRVASGAAPPARRARGRRRHRPSDGG